MPDPKRVAAPSRVAGRPRTRWTVADLDRWDEPLQLTLDAYADVLDLAERRHGRGHPDAHRVAGTALAKARLPAWRTLRRLLYQRDGGRCVPCGARVPFDLLEIGHLIEKALGGPDTPDNLACMCGDCNRRKPPHRTREEALAWIALVRAESEARDPLRAADRRLGDLGPRERLEVCRLLGVEGTPRDRELVRFLDAWEDLA